MSFKVQMSERTIKILDKCMEEMVLWHFDAINLPILLYQLAVCDDSQLADCLIDDDTIESVADVEGLVLMLLSDKQTELEIKDKEECSENGENKQGNTEEKGDATKEVAERPKRYKSEHDGDLILTDQSGKKHKYPVAQGVGMVFGKLAIMCKENNTTCAEPEHILAVMFDEDIPVLKQLFIETNASYREAKKMFTFACLAEAAKIPVALSSFLTCLNDRVDPSKPCEILMREKETEQIWNISLKKNKRNTVIVGEAGVGKTAIIEKIVYQIVTGTCPETFKDFLVMSLDVNSFIAGTKFRGDAEKRSQDLIVFLQEHDKVMLFIDEVHMLLGAGACYEGEMDLANALKPILARGDTIVIGATTEEEYNRYFSSDAALSRRFERVDVEEPLVSEVYPMIVNKIKALSKFHGVRITKTMVEYIIMIANCFAFEKKNPDKTLDLIDRSMVTAYRRGKKTVDKECVLANFQIQFDTFDGMGEETRKETAYHEAGHYIVARFSERLIKHRLLAISIMPAEGYLGITCFEYKRDVVPFTSKQYFIDLLALDLGGRVAEKLFRKEITSGACVDLNNATRVAFEVITRYGMTADGEDRNTVFLNSDKYPMFSEKTKDHVVEEVQKLIDLAYARAEAIIDEHKDFLDILVRALLKNHIMSADQVESLWQRHLKRKK
ncbi:MAG: AAA family ATPase [Clostridia bacterium]|nr:AAA family ATPase [Clostridia bacterium]